MTFKNDRVFPIVNSEGIEDKGLTIREHFAALAMQGFCSNKYASQEASEWNWVARASVLMADELIKELNKDSK